MKLDQVIGGLVLIVSAGVVSAFELPDFSTLFFQDNTSEVNEQLEEAKFELKAQHAILLDESLANKVNILVSRQKNRVLITGQAETEELREKAQQLVLQAASLKWTQGAANDVEPANALVCGEAALKTSGNEKRRSNLKTAKPCSTVNQFYNEIHIAKVLSAIQQSDDDVLRASIVNQLLHKGVIERMDAVKVIVSEKRVYLLGDQIDSSTAKEMMGFVSALPGVKTVMPFLN